MSLYSATMQAVKNCPTDNSLAVNKQLRNSAYSRRGG